MQSFDIFANPKSEIFSSVLLTRLASVGFSPCVHDKGSLWSRKERTVCLTICPFWKAGTNKIFSGFKSLATKMEGSVGEGRQPKLELGELKWLVASGATVPLHSAILGQLISVMNAWKKSANYLQGCGAWQPVHDSMAVNVGHRFQKAAHCCFRLWLYIHAWILRDSVTVLADFIALLNMIHLSMSYIMYDNVTMFINWQGSNSKAHVPRLQDSTVSAEYGHRVHHLGKHQHDRIWTSQGAKGWTFTQLQH